MQRILILLFSLWCTLAVSAQTHTLVTFDSAEITLADRTLSVEFANTFAQRSRGLMYRKSLCEDCGMLFRFSAPKIASMWMKNTQLPLDVAYIAANGTIIDIKPLTPHDLTPVGSSAKVLYALEMNQGWFKKNGVAEGDSIAILVP